MRPRRGGASWQTMLADLCLILFMVTAAAMGQPPPKRQLPPAARAGPTPVATAAPVRGEPLAVYRAVPGGLSLAQWLARQQLDPRMQLTIIATYAPGRRTAALAQAEALAGEAGVAATRARIVIEPAADGAADGVMASLAFDRAPMPNGTGLAG